MCTNCQGEKYLLLDTTLLYTQRRRPRLNSRARYNIASCLLVSTERYTIQFLRTRRNESLKQFKKAVAAGTNTIETKKEEEERERERKTKLLNALYSLSSFEESSVNFTPVVVNLKEKEAGAKRRRRRRVDFLNNVPQLFLCLFSEK